MDEVNNKNNNYNNKHNNHGKLCYKYIFFFFYFLIIFLISFSLVQFYCYYASLEVNNGLNKKKKYYAQYYSLDFFIFIQRPLSSVISFSCRVFFLYLYTERNLSQN